MENISPPSSHAIPLAGFASLTFDSLRLILNKLQENENAWAFNAPINAATSGMQNYYEAIQSPMDLGTITNKLNSNQYSSPADVIKDIQLVFRNAFAFFEKNSEIFKAALKLAKTFEALVLALLLPKSTTNQTLTAKAPNPLITPANTNSIVLVKEQDHEKFEAIIDSLEQLKDSDGRQISELFIDLPSQEEYPDYYQLIKEPICINDIADKKYETVNDFVEDFMTLFGNAQTYNLKGSLVYEDASLLYGKFVEEMSKRFPTVAVPRLNSIGRKTRRRNSNSQYISNEDEEFVEIDEESDSESDSMHDDENSPPEDDINGKKRKSDGTDGRRSKRSKSGVHYEESDEDEEEGVENQYKKEMEIEEETSNTIEKIFTDRVAKTDNGEPETQYYVKWKGKSYLHVSWVPASSLPNDSATKAKINRYSQKKLKPPAATNAVMAVSSSFSKEEEEFFPPDYCEVEKILACKDSINEQGKPSPMYLIKWTNLPYSESTWEFPDKFKDDEKIAEFKRFNEIPPIEIKPHIKMKWIKFEQTPKFKGDNQLRPYQLEGMNWLTFCWYEGRGSILADEMGLGKTVQSIAFMHYLRTVENIRGPFLVVAPLSTLGHWTREFEEWTNLNVIVYQGNKVNRELIRRYEFFYLNEKGKSINNSAYKFNVVLTTYEMVLSSDWGDLAKIKWRALIVDEAQRLKNSESKLITNLRQFKSDHRILLTGTPLQNNIQELWTLLNFIEPNKFHSLKDFMAEYGQLENSDHVTKLHTVLRPHLLRRMKEDVEKSIPPKEETIIEVELTSIQKQYYRAILDRNRDFLNKGCVGKNVPNLLNLFMQYRKICNHPWLLQGVEEKEISKKPTIEEYYRSFIHSSGKMVLLDKLLPKLKEQGHKVLIFSQMVRVLDLLEMYMKYKGYFYERLDGSVRRNERQTSIDRFCKPNSDRFAFLLCTRAGGLGINLTAADTVIIYDSDWNPQNDIQAQARCHRIGQTLEVKVYRLITAKTYERVMFERSSKKLGLDQAVLHDMGSHFSDTGKGTSALDKKEIDDLLKFGAYDLFREDDKEKEKKFVEEDIDQILNRSSKFVWNENTATVLSGGQSSFSKASFRTSRGIDVDFDDPNFWNKVLPEAKTPEKLLERIQKPEVLSEKENHELFIADLKELVDEILLGFKEGRAVEVSIMRSALLKVFEACKDRISEFTDEEREDIIRWSTEISKPRRERKSISRFGGQFETHLPFVWKSDKKDKKKGKKGKGSDSDVGLEDIESKGGPWLEKERKTFHSLFMSLGPGRWRDIQKKGQLNRSVEEMKEYGQEFIKQCIIHADENDRKIFIECLDYMVSSDSAQEIEVELKPDFTEYIKKKLKLWAKQLRIMVTLNEIMTVEPEDFEVPKLNKPLTSWWGMEEDRSLLLGIYKHGYGAYDEVKNDPELSFVKHAAKIEEAEKKNNSDSITVQVKTENKSNGATDNNNNNNNNQTSDSEEAPKPVPVKLSTKITLRLPSAWPQAKTLEVHVKYLLDTIKKLNAAAERERQRQVKQHEKEVDKKKKNQFKEKQWTKREITDFRIALMSYGAANWELIRSKATLHKSIDQIEKYFEQLLAQCRQIAVHQMNVKEENEEQEDSQANKESTDQETVKNEESNHSLKEEENEADSKISMDIEHPIKEELDKEKDESDQPTTKKEDKSQLSPGMARKLLKRIKLFEDIRNGILKSPELEERLKNSQQLDMPNWWNWTLDKVLLEGVSRFGIGTSEWDEYLDNSDCPFYKNESGVSEYRKPKCKFLKVFLKEKSPLLKRLEYLSLIVMDPKATVSASDITRRSSTILDFPYLYTRTTRSDSKKSKGEPDENLLFSMDLDPTKIKMNLKASTRDVSRDSEGKPILPITIKGATLTALGTIVWDRPNFHSRNYIWPVGYKSTRKFPSISNPGEYVTYTSEIIDGGSGPIFQVTPSDDPSLVIKHSTSSGVWCETLKLIKKRPNVSVSGPEMYGFSDPTVKMLIQELENAHKCKNYLWKDFDSPNNNSQTTTNTSNPASPSSTSMVSPVRESIPSPRLNQSLTASTPSKTESSHPSLDVMEVDVENSDSESEQVRETEDSDSGEAQ